MEVVKAEACEVSSAPVTYKGSACEVAQGKYESILEFRIPAKQQLHAVTTEEVIISPVHLSKNQPDGGKSAQPKKQKASGKEKDDTCNDMSLCLLETLDRDVTKTRDPETSAATVNEEVVEKASFKKQLDVDVDTVLL